LQFWQNVPKFLSLLRTALFSLLVLATVTLAYFSFERKVESFTRVDFSSRLHRGALEVLTNPDSPGSPLKAGDRIVLIDGAPVSSLEDPTETLSRPPFPHRLAVVRGGQVFPAALERPPTRVDLPYLFLSFVGIIYLVIGAATFSRERSLPALLFVGFCVSAFAIDFLTPSGPMGTFRKTIWLTEDFFRAVSPALLLHFFLIFPRPSRWRRYAGLLYILPALYFGAEIVLSLPGIAIPPASLPFLVELVERFWLLYFAAYGSAAVVRIAREAQQTEDPSSQRQARWIALGCGFGLIPFFLIYAVPRALGYSSQWADSAAVVPLVFVPLGFAYAILKWRLWDVDVFAREIVASTASVFLGVAGFVAINAIMNRVLPQAAAGAKNFLAFGSGIFLASLLVPVKRRLTDALERIQYGETYRARRALLDFSRQSRAAHDARELAAALTAHVSRALRASPCHVFLFDLDLPAGISAEALAEKLAHTDSVRVRSATFPSGEDLTFLRLAQDGYRHLFALKSGGRLIGALAVGVKEGHVPLSTEDLALVSTVLTQASLAFENAELYQALEKRMEASAEKDRLASLGVLAAGVAHEVNTPLAGISSYAQMLLADTEKADPRYEILKKMERQTFRASRLMRDLLDFARGRHGSQEPYDLSATVRDAIESVETELAARRVTVSTKGLDNPRPAKGSARELEQVFVNLLINARDASPEGSAITVSVSEDDGAYVVAVADRGRGLTDEAARRAFEPFFTKGTAGGTGLGLAISQEIVKRHGGRLTLEPRPDGGAVATVRLPR
jgi:signal transduction histidine kinase